MAVNKAQNSKLTFSANSSLSINANSYFQSYEDALAAARSAGSVTDSNVKYHYGQRVLVVKRNIATLYVIQPNKTLKNLGSSTISESGSIVIGRETIKITGLSQIPENQCINGINHPSNTTDLGHLHALIMDLDSTIKNLYTLINNKADKEEGKVMVTQTEIEKLSTIKENAEPNIIESIKIGTQILPIDGKSIVFPCATENSLGLVKGCTRTNGVCIDKNGEMEIISLNVNKLVQSEGDVLVLKSSCSFI